MLYSQAELNGFTRKLYRYLDDRKHQIEFKKLKVYRGYIHFNDDPSVATHMVLDYRERLISTLIHEVLHYLHPSDSESRILERERALINQLSERQVRNIIKRFAAIL